MLWSAKPIDEAGQFYAMYAIKKNPLDNKAPLTGDVVINATQDFDPYGNPSVSIAMNSEGASKWQRMTSEAANDPIRPKTIAIVLDNLVYSAPRVNEEIAGGRSQVTGSFDIQEAIDLANILQSGKLDAATQIIQEEIVGPSLGKASIDAGLFSLILGLAMILLFMVAYYSTSGLISNIVLLLNLFLIIGTLSSFAGATLTLSGMAGIVLTIGMAVDANVIIFERIREEIRKGKGLKLAIEDGFKYSYSAIIDANVTTLITAFMLLSFGLGPVKGFATVLIIGIFSSLFTAVLVTRLLFGNQIEKGEKYSLCNQME